MLYLCSGWTLVDLAVWLLICVCVCAYYVGAHVYVLAASFLFVCAFLCVMLGLMAMFQQLLFFLCVHARVLCWGLCLCFSSFFLEWFPCILFVLICSTPVLVNYSWCVMKKCFLFNTISITGTAMDLFICDLRPCPQQLVVSVQCMVDGLQEGQYLRLLWYASFYVLCNKKYILHSQLHTISRHAFLLLKNLVLCFYFLKIMTIF